MASKVCCVSQNMCLCSKVSYHFANNLFCFTSVASETIYVQNSWFVSQTTCFNSKVLYNFAKHVFHFKSLVWCGADPFLNADPFLKADPFLNADPFFKCGSVF